jgi:hypothetical protein
MKIRAMRSAVRTGATLAVLAVMAAACQKGGGGAGGGGGGTVQGAAASALDSLPKETGMVVGFSFQKFKSTKLFDLIQGAIPPDGKTQIDEFKATCSIDFMNDLDSVIVGGGGNIDKDRVLVLVKGKWDEAKVGKCATDMGAKKGKPITTAKDGAITTYTAQGEQPIHVAWAGDTALLTPASMEGDKTYLADLLKVKSTVKDNKPFMDILGKVDTTATFYAALLPDPGSEAATSLAQATGGTEKMTAAWVTVNLAKDLNVNGGMRFGTDAEAAAVAKRMTDGIAQAKSDPNMGQYMQAVTVAQAGTDVNLKMSLTEQQIDQLLQMAKQMLPFIAGSMLGGQQ